MSESERTRIGPWALTRFRLVLVVCAFLVLLLDSALLIRNTYVGAPWQQVWPAAVGVIVMLIVIVQTLRLARTSDAESTSRAR